MHLLMSGKEQSVLWKVNQTDYYYYRERNYVGIEKGHLYLAEGESYLMNFLFLVLIQKIMRDSAETSSVKRMLFLQKYYIPLFNRLELSGTPLNEAVIMLNHIIPSFKRQSDVQRVNVCIPTDGEANSILWFKSYLYDGEESRVTPKTIDYGNCALRDRKTGRVYPKMDYYCHHNIHSASS